MMINLGKYAHWNYTDMKVIRVINSLLTGSKAYSSRGVSSQKRCLAGEAIGLRRESTSAILLTEHSFQLPSKYLSLL